MKITLMVMVTLALLAAPTTAWAREPCLDCEPDEVTITGVLEERKYIPPPAVKEPARPAAIWVMRLTKPVCMRGAPNHPRNRGEKSVDEIQLTIVTPLDGPMYPGYREWRGKELEITGRLYHSQPAWGEGAAVRIKVSHIRQTKKDIEPLAKLPKDCLSCEPAVVTISGIIRRKTFPGPPEFESIKKGDRPMNYWILHPDNPVCVKGDFPSGLNEETELNISAFNL